VNTAPDPEDFEKTADGVQPVAPDGPDLEPTDDSVPDGTRIPTEDDLPDELGDAGAAQDSE
jgi:hypothetical protein